MFVLQKDPIPPSRTPSFSPSALAPPQNDASIFSLTSIFPVTCALSSRLAHRKSQLLPCFLGLRTLAKKRGCAGLLAEYRSPLAAPSASSRRPILFLASLPPYLWNTRHSASVAPLLTRRDTEAMSVLLKRALSFAIFAAIVFAALPARADEIRLKDGKKLYGVIVAYEDNMFKVKTDFGYVLVEKDKIAAIIPTTPASAKKDSQPAKPPAAKSEDAATQPAVDHTAGSAAVQPAIEKAAVEKKPAPKVTGAPVRPEIPAARNVKADAPVLKNSADTATPKIAADSASPATEGTGSSAEPRGNSGKHVHEFHTSLPHVQGSKLA